MKEEGASLVGSDDEESACNTGNLGKIPGWGRHSGEGNSYPLQYSCLTEWLTLSLFSWRKKGEMTTWWKSKREVAQSFPTLCNPMDCSPPGSSVHGILQARILEWVAISFSRESSQPRDWIQVSRIAGRCFNLWATREAHYIIWMMSSQIFCVS